ncbi:MAG: response regulator [Myxococcales bacterium]|nr:response regulator [Myxococcales bacterium]
MSPGQTNASTHIIRKALLVEADRVSQAVLSAHLRAEGFEVTTAHATVEAIQKAEDEPFDLAVFDLDIPGLDGLELRKRLERGAGKDVPVICMTGRPDRPRERFAVRDSPLLLKPIPRAHLRSAIEYIQSRVARRLRRDDSALRGQLEDYSLADLCRFMEQFSLSGRAEIRTEGNMGTVTFSAGQPADAAVGSQRGTKAFHRMLGWTDGQFRVDLSDSRVEKTINRPAADLIVSGVSRMGEWQRLRDRLPEAENEIRLARGDAMMCCPDDAARQIFLARIEDARPTLAAVLSSGAFDSVEAMARLVRDYENGRIEFTRVVSTARSPSGIAEDDAPVAGRTPPSITSMKVSGGKVGDENAHNVPAMAGGAATMPGADTPTPNETRMRVAGVKTTETGAESVSADGDQVNELTTSSISLVWEPPIADLDSDTDVDDALPVGPPRISEGAALFSEASWVVDSHAVEDLGAWFDDSQKAAALDAARRRRSWFIAGFVSLALGVTVGLWLWKTQPQALSGLIGKGEKQAEQSVDSRENTVDDLLQPERPYVEYKSPSLDGMSVDELELRGLALVQLGDLVSAEHTMRTLIARSPDHARARQSLGAILADLGKNEEALRTLELLDVQSQAPHDVVLMLGLLAHKKGDLVRAQTLYERFLEHAPGEHTSRHAVTTVLDFLRRLSISP